MFMDGDYLPCAEVEACHWQEATVKEGSDWTLLPRWALFSKGHETESWKLGRNPRSLSPAPLTDNRINLGILWNLSLNVIKGHMLGCQQNPIPCLYPEEGPERCCWPITYFQHQWSQQQWLLPSSGVLGKPFDSEQRDLVVRFCMGPRRFLSSFRREIRDWGVENSEPLTGWRIQCVCFINSKILLLVQHYRFLHFFIIFEVRVSGSWAPLFDASQRVREKAGGKQSQRPQHCRVKLLIEGAICSFFLN